MIKIPIIGPDFDDLLSLVHWTLTEPKNMCLWGFKMKSDKNGFNEKYLSENGF